jgi:hypothetical protein
LWFGAASLQRFEKIDGFGIGSALHAAIAPFVSGFPVRKDPRPRLLSAGWTLATPVGAYGGYIFNAFSGNCATS